MTSYPWKPPTIATGSCTANEIDALVSYIASHGSAGAPDWETNAGVGASCVKCVFGFNGPTWPPFVEQNDHQLGELNVGGCIAIASSSEACGRAYQHRFDCLYEACADCPADQGVVDSCLAAAPSDACRTASLAVVDACPNLDAAESACAGRTVYEGAIRAQCGAGVDGGVADAAAE